MLVGRVVGLARELSQVVGGRCTMDCIMKVWPSLYM